MSFDWLLYLAIGITLGVIAQLVRTRRQRRREEEHRESMESFFRAQRAIQETSEIYFAGLEEAILQDQQRLKEGDKPSDE